MSTSSLVALIISIAVPGLPGAGYITSACAISLVAVTFVTANVATVGTEVASLKALIQASKKTSHHSH